MEPRQPVSKAVIKRALELQARCWTYSRIAVELGISRRTIERHLRRANKRAAKHIEALAPALKIKQLNRLEVIADESMQGWERSKKDAKEIKRIKSKTADGVEVEQTVITVKGQAGNPAFLAQAQSAMADQRRMTGINRSDEIAKQRADQDTRQGDTKLDDSLARAKETIKQKRAQRERDSCGHVIPK